jgi:hypothetical protein
MSERIDRRYSDQKADPVAWGDAEARLAAAEVAWVVTVRPDGRPHATPVVPATVDGKIYFHTGTNEVKFANLQASPHVLVLAGDTAWDDGLDVAVEGTAAVVSDEALLRRLAAVLRERWDGRWRLDIVDGAVISRVPGTDLRFFEVTPVKAHGHAKGDPFGHTTYRF